jgi:site-specific DNA-methyltransferase (adenine-specific)
MSIIRTVQIGNCTLYQGDAMAILPELGAVDCIITDPPYSERTHKGHDQGARLGRDGAERKKLNYGALSEKQVAEVAQVFCAACDGWIVWMTDSTLSPAIHSALDECGRYVFAPLPFFQPGRSVRLSGDGPCSWTDWIICARTAKQMRWGTLPGGYVAGEGWADKERMGGKPTRLMQLLVQHYSRPEDLVCDPYMGAGTTGLAAVQEGRRFVGIEIDAAIFDIACRRIADAHKQSDLFVAKPQYTPPVQEPLL